MARHFLSLLSCCLLCYFVIVNSENILLRKLELLLSRTDKLIHYYGQNHEKFNFDGIFGLFVLQNHISGLVKTIRESKNGDNDLFGSITSDLQHKLDRINSFLPIALDSLQKRNASYFAKLGQLYQLSWKPTVAKYLMDIIPMAELAPVEPLTEQISDECLAKLFQNSHSNQACHLPVSCTTYLNQHNLLGYQLMHQILIISVLQKLGCTSAVDTFLSNSGYSLASLESSLCSAAFVQFQSLTSRPVFPEARDLIMEQIVLCGSAGYFQFASLNLLNQFLSWQHELGCFSDPGTSQLQMGRKLLFELRMSDGCLSHLTSVAAGSMAVYLTVFLSPGLPIEPGGQLSLYERVRSSLLNARVPSLPKLIEEPLAVRLNELSPWSPSVNSSIFVRISAFHRFPVKEYHGKIDWFIPDVRPSFAFPAFVICLIIICVYSIHKLRYRRI